MLLHWLGFTNLADTFLGAFLCVAAFVHGFENLSIVRGSSEGYMRSLEGRGMIIRGYVLLAFGLIALLISGYFAVGVAILCCLLILAAKGANNVRLTFTLLSMESSSTSKQGTSSE